MADLRQSDIAVQQDPSIGGDINKAKITGKKIGYRDLDLSLKIHPIRKDITPLRDDAAIKNAVKNLLQSNYYERPFSNNKGANLRARLFEPADAITKVNIRRDITRVIQRYEPRVRLLSINIDDLADQNAYKILVKFQIKENDTTTGVEIVLRRLR